MGLPVPPSGDGGYGESESARVVASGDGGDLSDDDASVPPSGDGSYGEDENARVVASGDGGDLSDDDASVPPSGDGGYGEDENALVPPARSPSSSSQDAVAGQHLESYRDDSLDELESGPDKRATTAGENGQIG